MDKQQLLHHLKNEVFCRLKASKIHGVGVFAIKKIPKGTNPFPGAPSYNTISFTKKELSGLDLEVKKIIFDLVAAEEDIIELPDVSPNSLDISFYVNHSESPNLKYSDNKEELITLREIEVGEELTSSYDELNNPKELDF